MSRYRIDINYEYPSDLDENEFAIEKDDVYNMLDEIEGFVVTIREKLEGVSGLDLIDEVVNELKELEAKLF